MRSSLSNRLRQEVSSCRTVHSTAAEAECNSLLRDLADRDEEKTLKAVQGMVRLAHKSESAPLVTENLGAVVKCLGRNNTRIQLLALEVLAGLVENGQVVAVGMQLRDAVQFLKKNDQLEVRAKACSLCRKIAEEGGASFLSQYVDLLLEWSRGKVLVAPLKALAAMAAAGEVAAVCKGIDFFLELLLEESPKDSRMQMGAAEVVAAIGREGGAERVQRWLDAEAGADGSTHKCLLMKALTRLVLDEKEDIDSRLAPAEALKCLMEADPEVACCVRDRRSFSELHDLPWNGRYKDSELALFLRELLGISKVASVADHGQSSCDDDDTDNVCVICVIGLARKIDIKVLACGHSFHADCIQSWFTQKQRQGQPKSCPTCRTCQDCPKKTVSAPSSPGAGLPALPRGPQRASSVPSSRRSANASRGGVTPASSQPRMRLPSPVASLQRRQPPSSPDVASPARRQSHSRVASPAPQRVGAY